MPLDERRLLLNGLQPAHLSSSSSTYSSSRPSKRQKTEGMNSRYDRMIQTVNTMHGPPHPRVGERRMSRGRAISSSSATSCEVPKTPSGANPEDYRLGRDFSVLKMRVSESSLAGTDMFALDAFRDLGSTRSESKECLPPWLRGTISSLAPKHPLRLLDPGQSTAQGDSSPSILGMSSDPLPTPHEDSPFAFFPPVNPSRKTSPPAFSVDSTDGDLEPSFLLRDSARFSHALLGNSRLPEASPVALPYLETSLRPFSTPGPASAFSVERNTIPPLLRLDESESPFATATSTTLLHRIDEDESLATFVPFSTSGPLRSPPPSSVIINTNHHIMLRASPPARFPSSPALRSPGSPAPASWGITTPSSTHSPAVDLRLGVSPIFSPPRQPPALAFKRFATPGPAHLVLSPARTRDPRSLRPPPARLPPNTLHYDQFRRDLLPSYIPLPSPSVEPPSCELASACDVLDFKWERFDRSNPQLGLSSSPVRIAAESEETFWSQPAQAILDASCPGGRRDASPVSSPYAAPHGALPYSPAHSPDRPNRRIALLRDPAQLRAAVPQASPADLPRTPVSQDHAHDEHSLNDSHEDEAGPFAWIVAPRDQPAPSTPRRRTADPRAESGPATPMPGAARGSSRRPHSQRERVVPSPDALRASGPASPRCGPSFAPAPGINLSPLSVENEVVTIDTDARSRDTDVSHAAIIMKTENTSPAKRSRPDATLAAPVTSRRTGEVPVGMEDEEQACEGPVESAKYLGVEEVAVHDTPQRFSSDIEEVDELVGASQASRDSIESWSD